MLTDDEVKELEELDKGKWTMSGYGPGSEEQVRMDRLKSKMWTGVEVAELLDEGDPEVYSFNRKDPYENIGFKGVITFDYIPGTDIDYRMGFDLDYIDETLSVTPGENELVVANGEEALEIDGPDQLLDYLEDYWPD